MTTSVTDILCDIDRLNAILDTLLESLWLGPVDSVFNVSTAYASHRNLAFRGHKRETKSLRFVTSFLHEQLNERMNIVLFKREEALAFTNELFPIGTTTNAKTKNLDSALSTHGSKERKWVARQNQEFNFDFNTPGPTRPQMQLQQPLDVRADTPEIISFNNSNRYIDKKVQTTSPLMPASHKLQKRSSLNLFDLKAQYQLHFAKPSPAAEQQPGYLAATISSSSRLRLPRAATPRGNIENSNPSYGLSPSPSNAYNSRHHYTNYSIKNNTSKKNNSNDQNSAGQLETSPLSLRKMKSTGALRENMSINYKSLSSPSIPLPPLDLELFKIGPGYSGMVYTQYERIAST